jgi:hypothetical protein
MLIMVNHTHARVQYRQEFKPRNFKSELIKREKMDKRPIVIILLSYIYLICANADPTFYEYNNSSLYSTSQPPGMNGTISINLSTTVQGPEKAPRIANVTVNENQMNELKKYNLPLGLIVLNNDPKANYEVLRDDSILILKSNQITVIYYGDVMFDGRLENSTIKLDAYGPIKTPVNTSLTWGKALGFPVTKDEGNDLATRTMRQIAGPFTNEPLELVSASNGSKIGKRINKASTGQQTGLTTNEPPKPDSASGTLIGKKVNDAGMGRTILTYDDLTAIAERGNGTKLDYLNGMKIFFFGPQRSNLNDTGWETTFYSGGSIIYQPSDGIRLDKPLGISLDQIVNEYGITQGGKSVDLRKYMLPMN